MKNNSQTKSWVTYDPQRAKAYVFGSYQEAWQKAEAIFECFGHVAVVEPMVEVA